MAAVLQTLKYFVSNEKNQSSAAVIGNLLFYLVTCFGASVNFESILFRHMMAGNVIVKFLMHRLCGDPSRRHHDSTNGGTVVPRSSFPH